MLILCDKCGSALTEKDIVILENSINEEVREVFYITYCCNNKNVVGYKSVATDKVEEDITKARRDKNTKVIPDLINRLRDEMNKLMLEYGGTR